jgi:hypothetical protein
MRKSIVFLCMALGVTACNRDARNDDLLNLGILAWLAQTSTASVTGIYQVIAEQTNAGTTASMDFSGLNGDTDIEYRITGRIAAAQTCTFTLTINGDTSNIYRHQYTAQNNTTNSTSFLSRTDFLVTNGAAMGAFGRSASPDRSNYGRAGTNDTGFRSLDQYHGRSDFVKFSEFGRRRIVLRLRQSHHGFRSPLNAVADPVIKISG